MFHDLVVKIESYTVRTGRRCSTLLSDSTSDFHVLFVGTTKVQANHKDFFWGYESIRIPTPLFCKRLLPVQVH